MQGATQRLLFGRLDLAAIDILGRHTCLTFADVGLSPSGQNVGQHLAKKWFYQAKLTS